MISTLRKKKNATNYYYCSNCMIIQPFPLKTNCPFCGNYFSNYEEIIIKETKEQMEGEKNESNLYGKN